MRGSISLAVRHVTSIYFTSTREAALYTLEECMATKTSMIWLGRKERVASKRRPLYPISGALWLHDGLRVVGQEVVKFILDSFRGLTLTTPATPKYVSGNFALCSRASLQPILYYFLSNHPFRSVGQYIYRSPDTSGVLDPRLALPTNIWNKDTPPAWNGVTSIQLDWWITSDFMIIGRVNWQAKRHKFD